MKYAPLLDYRQKIAAEKDFINRCNNPRERLEALARLQYYEKKLAEQEKRQLQKEGE